VSDWNVPLTLTSERLPETIASRTRRTYDLLAGIYPASTFFFHAKAHRWAVENSGILDGMRVLEVATGSGEMFRRLVRANPNGCTIGLDLSPNMAARTQRHARTQNPGANVHCQAVDVRHMPFRGESFDAVMCCLLLELLAVEDISLTLREIRRVLKPGGRFTLVMIGENSPRFNFWYRVGGGLVPSFWGRQVEQTVAPMLPDYGFEVEVDHRLKQNGYPARIMVANRGKVA
jgi:ubiquinone/menaquinone biosynthesis C-methylase UbiE